MPEDLTWSFEWGQRVANLPALTMEQQPSSVTRSHSQTSFMCKLSLGLLFTHCAFKYVPNQMINVMAELEICSIYLKRNKNCWSNHYCPNGGKQLETGYMVFQNIISYFSELTTYTCSNIVRTVFPPIENATETTVAFLHGCNTWKLSFTR